MKIKKAVPLLSLCCCLLAAPYQDLHASGDIGATTESIENPGQVEDTGQVEAPEQAENTGQVEAPEQTENTGQVEAPGQAEDTGQVEAPEQVENTSQTENSGQIDNTSQIGGNGQVDDGAQGDVMPINIGATAETEHEMMAEILISIYKQLTSDEVKYYSDLEDEEIETLFAQVQIRIDGAAFKSSLKPFFMCQKETGSINMVEGYKVEQKGEEIKVTATINCEKRNMLFEVMINSKGRVSGLIVNAEYTRAEMMKKAGLNTVMGLCTVFVILVLISFIISGFKYIPGMEAYFRKKYTDRKNRKTNLLQGQNEAADELPIIPEEFKKPMVLQEDKELAAVISAAVAAAIGTDTEGFVVRSIKRRPHKWKH